MTLKVLVLIRLTNLLEMSVLSHITPERLKAALLFTLEEECIKQGHTYLPRTIVIETTQNLLNEDIEKPIETEQLLEIIDVLSEEKN